MIITLTGTPGTGKTTLSDEFDKYKIIHLTEFVKKHDLGQREEEFEVNIPEMKSKLEQEISDNEEVVIEGHLAHHFPSDYCIVLRCDPEILEKRLKERDYSTEKVNENVESEILDIILTESLGLQNNIIEIDTTEKQPVELHQIIKERINNDETGYGEVDWTDRI